MASNQPNVKINLRKRKLAVSEGQLMNCLQNDAPIAQKLDQLKLLLSDETAGTSSDADIVAMLRSVAKKLKLGSNLTSNAGRNSVKRGKGISISGQPASHSSSYETGRSKKQLASPKFDDAKHTSPPAEHTVSRSNTLNRLAEEQVTNNAPSMFANLDVKKLGLQQSHTIPHHSQTNNRFKFRRPINPNISQMKKVSVTQLQRFTNPNVLVWLEKKEKMLRDQRKQMREARNKRRAELQEAAAKKQQREVDALLAFNRWLRQKRKEDMDKHAPLVDSKSLAYELTDDVGKGEIAELPETFDNQPKETPNLGEYSGGKDLTEAEERQPEEWNQDSGGDALQAKEKKGKRRPVSVKRIYSPKCVCPTNSNMPNFSLLKLPHSVRSTDILASFDFQLPRTHKEWLKLKNKEAAERRALQAEAIKRSAEYDPVDAELLQAWNDLLKARQSKLAQRKLNRYGSVSKPRAMIVGQSPTSIYPVETSSRRTLRRNLQIQLPTTSKSKSKGFLSTPKKRRALVKSKTIEHTEKQSLSLSAEEAYPSSRSSESKTSVFEATEAAL